MLKSVKTGGGMGVCLWPGTGGCLWPASHILPVNAF